MKNKKELNEVLDQYYQEVVDRVEVVEGDEAFRESLKGDLAVLMKKSVVTSIWNNMNKEQSAKFKDFSADMARLSPTMTQEQILCNFAVMDANLWNAMLADLDIVVEKFCSRIKLGVS